MTLSTSPGAPFLQNPCSRKELLRPLSSDRSRASTLCNGAIDHSKEWSRKMRRIMKPLLFGGLAALAAASLLPSPTWADRTTAEDSMVTVNEDGVHDFVRSEFNSSSHSTVRGVRIWAQPDRGLLTNDAGDVIGPGARMNPNNIKYHPQSGIGEYYTSFEFAANHAGASKNDDDHDGRSVRMFIHVQPSSTQEGRPTITGPATPRVGDTLGVDLSNIEEAARPNVTNLLWQRCRAGSCNFISPHSWTYTLTAADLGHKLHVATLPRAAVDKWSPLYPSGDKVVQANPNNAPTALTSTVPPAGDTLYEDGSYRFTPADFRFSDANGDPLASVTIRSLPGRGELMFLDSAVSEGQTLKRSALDAGGLKYTAPSRPGFTRFTFTVNDGEHDSASATMRITVTDPTIPGTGGPAPDPASYPPGAPRKVDALPRNGEVVLRWLTPNPALSDAPLLYYQYRYAAGRSVGEDVMWHDVPDGSDEDVDAANETLYRVTNLTNGTQYTFEVRAVNDNGPGSANYARATPTGGSTGTGGGGGGGGGSGGGGGGGSFGGGGGGGGGTTTEEEEVAEVVGYLENPGPASFQSGIGVLSGWVCEAETVEIELGELGRQAAGYGTERLDTEAECGDVDNGFGLLFNWNRLGDGEHEVVAWVDDVELGRATVRVTTVGEGEEEEFLRGVAGGCEVPDFPMEGETVTLVWQQSQQNFVLAAGEAPASQTDHAGLPGVGYLENPGSNSFQSGIGVLSGWVCEGEEVEVELGDLGRQVAAYGTERVDTESVCGDVDNGFGLLFNWNRLGDGEHEVVAWVDDVELGRATVRVTTVGEGEEEEFLRGVAGGCEVPDFPAMDQTVTLEWQQNSQNFVITEVE